MAANNPGVKEKFLVTSPLVKTWKDEFINVFHHILFYDILSQYLSQWYKKITFSKNNYTGINFRGRRDLDKFITRKNNKKSSNQKLKKWFRCVNDFSSVWNLSPFLYTEQKDAKLYKCSKITSRSTKQGGGGREDLLGNFRLWGSRKTMMINNFPLQIGF